MTASRIGVGIIGANPDRGWAKDAHIPALKASPHFEIRAVATSRPVSARAAAEHFSVPHAVADHRELVTRPDIDLVVVSVKVPMHRELVTAAIEAGKHVYCEWPLARDPAEARELAALARRRGVHAVVGLQARSNPAVRHARDLVARGWIGMPLSTSIVASAIRWGSWIDRANAYTQDGTTGATMLAIPFGHTVDACCWTLGEFRELSATLAVRRPDIVLQETGETVRKTAADQIAVSGALTDGTVASLHFRGGSSRGTDFLWEINGTEGDLRIVAANGHLQMATAGLLGGRGGQTGLEELITPPEFIPAHDAPAGRPFNVAQAYAQLAADLRRGTTSLPGFDEAVIRHALLETIQTAADTGRRQSPPAG